MEGESQRSVETALSKHTVLPSYYSNTDKSLIQPLTEFSIENDLYNQVTYLFQSVYLGHKFHCILLFLLVDSREGYLSGAIVKSSG